MSKYIIIFGIAYAVAVVAAAIVTELLNLSGSTNAATLIAAGFFASARFVNDHQRVPTKQEKRVLVWASLGTSLAVSGALVAASLLLSTGGSKLIQAIVSIPLAFLAFGLFVACAVSLLMLHLSYGWFAGVCAKKIAKGGLAQRNPPSRPHTQHRNGGSRPALLKLTVVGHHKSMSAFVRVGGVIFWGAIAWLFVAALLALQFWPHLPESTAGWVAFIAFGPPLYVLGEASAERFWSSRFGRSLSRPSPTTQAVFVVLSLVIGGAFAWGLWWLYSH